MSVKIRLARTGRKKICRYRVVAADSRMARDGRFLENLGHYNPQAQPKEFVIKTERMAYWVKQGAEPSDTVRMLLEEDRFFEKMDALDKGIALDTLNLQRVPEAKHKPKKRAKKEKSA